MITSRGRRISPAPLRRVPGGSPAAVRRIDPATLPKDALSSLIKSIEKDMKEAAKALEFEKAAALRDQLVELRGLQVQEKLAG